MRGSRCSWTRCADGVRLAGSTTRAGGGDGSLPGRAPPGTAAAPLSMGCGEPHRLGKTLHCRPHCHLQQKQRTKFFDKSAGTVVELPWSGHLPHTAKGGAMFYQYTLSLYSIGFGWSPAFHAKVY